MMELHAYTQSLKSEFFPKSSKKMYSFITKKELSIILNKVAISTKLSFHDFTALFKIDSSL